VSLAPNITELLFTAAPASRHRGGGVRDYPAAAKKLPRIGDAFRIDYERVVALEPDLIIAWQDGTPPTIIEELSACISRCGRCASRGSTMSRRRCANWSVGGNHGRRRARGREIPRAARDVACPHQSPGRLRVFSRSPRLLYIR